MSLLMGLAFCGIVVPLSGQSTYTVDMDTPRQDTPAKKPKAGEITITLAVTDSTLGYVLRTIGQRASRPIVYNDTDPRFAKKISIRLERATLMNALASVLQGTGLTATVAQDGETIVVRSAKSSADTPQDSGTITGLVLDSATRKGIEGATITVSGTRITAMTTPEGRFLLRGVAPGQQTLEARLFGYKAGSVSTVVSPDRPSTVTIVLNGLPTALTEVVTTATGQQRRLEIGNSVTSINMDSLLKVVPVKNLTDVFDAGRVPGLVVSRSNGAPGAPARIRIRGIGSINATNDPIIIIDGVRSYSGQTTSEADAAYSVLDRIDVNTIETIEVFKGPSASALYGSDAATGVIVIKTKQGTPGRTRWTFRMDQEQTKQPGESPDLYYRQGYPLLGGRPLRCRRIDICLDDTLFVFNPLADQRTTVLGTGNRQAYAGTVDGGSEMIRYALGGQVSSAVGELRMSDADIALLEQVRGLPVPKWQREPLTNMSVGGNAKINMQLNRQFSISLTTSLNRSLRGETPLKNALSVYERASPADTSLVTGSISNFTEETTFRELATRNVVNSEWKATSWIHLRGDIGYETLARQSQALLRRGDCLYPTTEFLQQCEEGLFRSERGARSEGSVNLFGTVRIPQWLGIRFTPALGVNYRRATISDVGLTATGLPLGGTSSVGAAQIDALERGSEPVSLGVFVNTNVALFDDRLFTSFGTRVDASNALGTQVRPTYPKLDLSYLVSRERWFPFRSSTFRVRLAYGHSGVQPEIGSTSRTYVPGTGVENSVIVPTLEIATLGNATLRPERSTEIEGGFDLGVLYDRFVIGVTQYRKQTRDMLVSLYVPNSLGEIGQRVTNLGSVRNSGLELNFDGRIIASDRLQWSVHGTYSKNQNTLIRIADDFPSLGAASGAFQSRFVEGYPLYGVWMRPVLTYNDQNLDNVLTSDEILRADSTVYVGGPLPNFETTFSTQIGVLNNKVTLTLNGQYTDGVAQVNQNGLSGNADSPWGTSIKGLQGYRALWDPSVPLPDQAAFETGYVFLHKVSALRVTSLSIRVVVPNHMARKIRASAMSVAIRGSNLGLWTNYSGRDPNVNDSILGNTTRDSGNLPMPRTWGINVSINY